jgi:hypothetical protein
MKTWWYISALAALSLGVCPVRAAVAQATQPVALLPGACPTVTDGDIVTLDWNPGFENSFAVAALSGFSLNFVQTGRSLSRDGSGGLFLRASTARGAAVPDAIVPMGNGFYRIRMRIDVKSDDAGVYHLARATAEPIAVPGYTGKAPEMTNNPANSSFCLTLTAPAQTQRGR